MRIDTQIYLTKGTALKFFKKIRIKFEKSKNKKSRLKDKIENKINNLQKGQK